MKMLVAVLIGLVLLVLLLQGRQLLIERQAALDREQAQASEWEMRRRLHDEERHAPPERVGDPGPWLSGHGRPPAWLTR